MRIVICMEEDQAAAGRNFDGASYVAAHQSIKAPHCCIIIGFVSLKLAVSWRIRIDSSFMPFGTCRMPTGAVGRVAAVPAHRTNCNKTVLEA